jgi:hypothetical protein
MSTTPPPADSAYAGPPPAAPPAYGVGPATAPRPGIVTGAGGTLIALGVLTGLFGLVMLLGASIFAGAAGSIDTSQMPGASGFFGAVAGALIVLTLIIIGFGVLQFIAGLKILSGRGWARITGIVLAIIGLLFGLAGLGGDNGPLLGLVLVVANGFVLFALFTTGDWFAARSAA